jgi:hypothetical protein
MQEANTAGDDNGRFFSHNQNPMDNNIGGYHYQSQDHHFSQFRNQTKEETPAKRTSVIHEFNRIYRPKIQELREFEEIVSYLQDHFFAPTHPQLSIADHSMYNPANNITGSNYTPSSNPTVGFRSFACAQCLGGLVEAVLLSDVERIGPAYFKIEQACRCR